MESQKPKIALYAKRSFGEKMNASFDFIKENWKQLLKYSTYLILPVCLLQGMSINGLMGNITDFSALSAGQAGGDAMAAFGLSFILNYVGTVFFSALGGLLLASLIYALVNLYNEREERLGGLSFGTVRPLLFHNAKRLFLLGVVCCLLSSVVMTIVALLAVLTPYTLLLTIPLCLAFLIPLALIPTVYLFENISLGQAFAKTYRLGFATWGGVFLMLLVMSIIAGVMQTVFSIPWSVIYFVKMVFTLSDSGEASSTVGLDFAQYLFSVLMLYGSYLSAIFTIVGLVYQYGHASEVVDSITVEDDIENFDKL